MAVRNLLVVVALLGAAACSTPDPLKTCLDTSTNCDGVCVDLNSDEANCGACNNACGYGNTCNAGVCGPMACPGTFTNCDAVCVDLSSDDANCGACNNACKYGSACIAGVCGAIYGEPDQLGGTTTFGPNYLLGTAIDVSRQGSLLRFGILAPSTAAGNQLKMALYKDSGGNPASLVASIPATVLAGGRQEIAITPVTLTPGRYWIMAVYNVDTAGYRSSPTFESCKYVALTFTSALPTTFPAPTTYVDGPFNYYVVTSD